MTTRSSSSRSWKMRSRVARKPRFTLRFATCIVTLLNSHRSQSEHFLQPMSSVNTNAGPWSLGSTCLRTSMHWVGQWKEAIECNIAAVEADDRYVELTGNESQFYKFYRMHNHHFVVWCAMFDGQYETALKYMHERQSIHFLLVMKTVVHNSCLLASSQWAPSSWNPMSPCRGTS